MITPPPRPFEPDRQPLCYLVADKLIDAWCSGYGVSFDTIRDTCDGRRLVALSVLGRVRRAYAERGWKIEKDEVYGEYRLKRRLQMHTTPKGAR